MVWFEIICESSVKAQESNLQVSASQRTEHKS